MGSTCCTTDNDKDIEGPDESGKPVRRTYDDSDDSDDPDGVNAGMMSDDEPPNAQEDSDDGTGDNGHGGGASSPGGGNRLNTDNLPLLTSRNSTINAINQNIMTGWQDAVSSGNDSLVMHLYEEYKDYDVINTVFENGDNSLHQACQTKKLNVAYFLLTKGISVNAVNDKNGNTALHYACEQRDEKMVKLLIKNNADPDVANQKGKTPFDIAKRYRSTKIQELIKQASEKKAVASAFGDEQNDDELDALMGNKPNAIHRPTELKGVKIGVYVDGVLGQSDNEMADSDNESNNQINKYGTDLTEKSKNDDSDSDSYQKPQTKEEKENQETQLELHRIKQRNPFVKRKLERRVTKKILESGPGSELNRKSSVADNEILAEKRAKLPELEGWLEKRKPRPPYQWQKRWVIVKDTHILWSDKQRSIDDPSNQSQRKEFNGFLNINVLQEVVKYDTKSQNKFVIKARDAKRAQTREYMWKCPSMEDRNYWVKGLKMYMKYHEDAYKFGIV